MATMTIPDEQTVLEASRLASAAHLHLVTDGHRTLLSPIVPTGWIKISVSSRKRLLHHIGEIHD